MKESPILPPTYLFVYLILAFIFHFFFPIINTTNFYRYFGIVFIIIGLAINIWTDGLFKKEKTTVKPNKAPSKLITEGPFRLSRHPMYLGFVLLLIGIAIILGSLSSFVAPLMMFITLERKFIPIEEKQMEKCFGEKYLEYKCRVRRWL
jgi:protein-S-isoprenylcysteine O-methyltransferase Ste14